MKTDIIGKKEIEVLIDTFYDKVKSDPVIGFMFAHVNWEHHLPVMYSFWENTLFYTGGYTGNPLKVHQALDRKTHLTPEHFKEWQDLFISTVDELFTGEKAELAKQRALSISTVMQIKLGGAS
ncbi:MAG: group III truncated hemoglobin [Taibaiella sp.]|jgi:hemoglobin|nr:group III truncated hemoglobin [Taibaiella sp.]